jgi:hypothetical protein
MSEYSCTTYVGASAMALYGAVRSAGEFVIEATDRPNAVHAAIRTLDCFIDGMASSTR